MTATVAARIFAGLITLVCAFQLALALGAPWGEFAMGGGTPGVYPAPMRLAAVVQLIVLAVCALIMLSRAGLMLSRWRGLARPAAWVVVILLAASLALNLITPSLLERLIWAPVVFALLLSGLRVASSR